MSITEPETTEPPRGHVKVVYLGPVAPHWEIRSDFGDNDAIDEFRSRAMARLLLLPPHDPQFRRNRERVARDAERENYMLEWDLGEPEETAPPAQVAAPEADPAPDAEAAPEGEVAPADEPAAAETIEPSAEA